jgi:VCPO second helical-bundle domain
MTAVHRIVIAGCVTVLTVALTSSVAASSRGASSGAVVRDWTGDVIRDWNDTARSQQFGNPLRLARILAIMHAAQHDAVNGAQPRYDTYASTLHDPGADAEAAAAAAAHEVLLAFFPASQAALDDRLVGSLAAVPDGDAEDAGVALGRAVGDFVLAARADDGYGTSDPFSPAPGPGVWEPTAPAFAPMLEPQFQIVTPFTLRDREQFLPDPPPALTSERYARDYHEVKLIGQDTSPARTADQTHTAHFWAEPSPSGWSRVGNLVSARYHYDLHDTARLQALLNMAMADGFIVGWFQKRQFAFWRPVTAIRKADTDGNPGTEPDPSWLSLRPTPPLPDYPSTHSLLGGAAAEILRRITGTDVFPFCMVSTTSAPSGTQRCWDSFTQAELENAESRVLAGFHFRFAIETGVKVGRQVGQFATRHALRPLNRSAQAPS